ncbi:MAG: hypothetical protein AAFO07_06705 [Bacteroidota bacterium]
MSEKGIFFLILLLPFWVSLEDQSSDQEAISMGDQALKQQQFEKAINYYFAAEAFDPAKGDFVKLKVSKAFKAIQALKIEADNKTKALQLSQAELRNTLEEVDQARSEAQSNLDKANKLIDAFYFYKDRFALAYKDSRFYYIDKEGDAVAKLGGWNKAEQFDEQGFAKVEEGGKKYFLDTLGQKYELANSIEELNENTLALDLRGKKLDSFPEQILNFPQLKLLFFNQSSTFKNIPDEIEKLNQLYFLDLSGTAITSLPTEIGQLSNLLSLNLSSCYSLDSLPTEIGQLSNLRNLDLGTCSKLSRFTK